MKRSLLLLLVPLVACGARTSAGGLPRDTVDASVDVEDAADGVAEASPDVAPDGPKPPCDLAKPFGKLVPIVELNTPDQWEGMMRLSPDGLTAYYQRHSESTLWDVWTASRAGPFSPFGNAKPIAAIDTTDGEGAPFPSADGLTLFFGRTSQATQDYDVWVATRTSTADDFGAPSLAGLPRRSLTPYLVRDDVLYFATNPTVDIVRATWKGPSAFGPIVSQLTTPRNESWPALTADELTMYYSIGGSGVGSGIDIAVATRSSRDVAFAPGTRVKELDTDADELVTFVSPDGCTLYVSSTAEGTLDLYVTRKP